MHLPEYEKSAISHTIAHTLAHQMHSYTQSLMLLWWNVMKKKLKLYCQYRERTRSSTWMNLIQRSLIRLVINTCQHVHSLDYAHIKLIRFITWRVQDKKSTYIRSHTCFYLLPSFVQLSVISFIHSFANLYRVIK